MVGVCVIWSLSLNAHNKPNLAAAGREFRDVSGFIYVLHINKNFHANRTVTQTVAA